jgi:alpha-tubulin suppressor-like RCC1 family protein
VDGSPYTDATTTTKTGDTVPAADTVADEEWTCTVTPNDGEEEGDPATDSATVVPAVWLHVSAGAFHTCGIDSAGSLECWGYDHVAQVADAPTGSGYTAVGVGAVHNCALDSSGSIDCWGDDDYGQVSDAP